ncbi:MAG: TetR/AcrR family transcriptional regulator [Acidimicrobiia bacterium]
MSRGTTSIDPRIERSRAAIIPAAIETFLANGYQATNVDEIAAAARVSKRTIYNIFGDKERLFREIIAETFAAAEAFSSEVAESLVATDDIRATLEAAAIQLAAIVLSDRVMRLRRLLIGEAERFPELASEYYARAPGRVISVIAGAFEDLGNRGLLQIDDPLLAAEQFAYLVVGAQIDRALFHTQRLAPSDDDITARARYGVATFLKAHQPDR